MPIIESAKKALRQSKKREAQNKEVKRAMKDAVRELEQAIEAGEKKEAQQLLSAAYKRLDKAAKKGVIKKNTASRKKSRLYKALKKLMQKSPQTG